MYRIAETIPLVTRKKTCQCTSKYILQKSVQYSTGTSQSKSSKKPVLYIVGISTLSAAGVITYAKYDPRFRKILDFYVPGTDGFIKFAFQEEKSYLDSVISSVTDGSKKALNSVYNAVGFGEKPKESSQIAPPPPLIKTPSVQKSLSDSPKRESIATESKVQTQAKPAPLKKEDDPPAKVVKTENPKNNAVISVPEKETIVKAEPEKIKKFDVSDMEKNAVNSVKAAVAAYKHVREELKSYREVVATLVEQSVETDDHKNWFKIKELTERKDKLIEDAEKKGSRAMKKIERLKLLINDPKNDIELNVKTNVEQNMKNVLNDLVNEKAVFAQERQESSVTEKFSKKVEESRKALSKELGSLFPSLLIDSENIASDEELDLFVLYTTQLLNHYQTELHKAETIYKSKLKQILQLSQAGNPEFIQESINVEVEKVKRALAQEMLKVELELKLELERELRNALRRQAEVHADYVDEILTQKDKESERKLSQYVSQQVDELRTKYNRQLARVIGRLKGFETIMNERAVVEKQARHSQTLWNACQSLILALTSASNTIPWEKQLTPLEPEVNAISKAAAEGDELVSAVIAAIPKEALSRGVFTELALKDRFFNVERLAYRLARLPDGYASIPSIFLSYLQSYLLVNISRPVPEDELADKPFDPSTLNNYDVLNRARYWLDRGDYQQTLQYMNLLQGAARAVANDWMKEMRIYLETKQAAQVLMSHAVYSNLVHLQIS